MRFLKALVALVLFTACASTPPYVWYTEVAPDAARQSTPIIHPGDRILVQVDGHKDLSGEFVIGVTGEYSHPVVGLIAVGGLNSQAASEQVARALGRIVNEPRVGVVLLQRGPINVAVVGEVGSAGAFELPHASGVLAALGRAGGLSDFAKVDHIYVLRKQPKPQRIRFRFSDLTNPEPAAVTFELRDGDTILVE